jgi:DNA-binding CsgD family transcriptional regulator
VAFTGSNRIAQTTRPIAGEFPRSLLVSLLEAGGFLMRPYAKLISAGHGIDAEFGRALPVAQKFDPSRIAEGMQDCVRFADLVHLTDVTGANPLGWHYPADIGVDRMTKIDSLVAGCDSRACLGERTDQSFAQGVLLPTYFETIAAGQPVVHRVVGVANNVLLSYSKLTVPHRASLRSSQVSHLLIISHIDIAIPLARSETRPLTFRERQCLALAASGLVTKQIAAEIGISEKTVELHLARARHKLGAHTTAQAVAIDFAMATLER